MVSEVKYHYFGSFVFILSIQNSKLVQQCTSHRNLIAHSNLFKLFFENSDIKNESQNKLHREHNLQSLDKFNGLFDQNSAYLLLLRIQIESRTKEFSALEYPVELEGDDEESDNQLDPGSRTSIARRLHCIPSGSKLVFVLDCSLSTDDWMVVVTLFYFSLDLSIVRIGAKVSYQGGSFQHLNQFFSVFKNFKLWLLMDLVRGVRSHDTRF